MTKKNMALIEPLIERRKPYAEFSRLGIIDKEKLDKLSTEKKDGEVIPIK